MATSDPEEGAVFAGLCPTHGPVAGEVLIFNFPAQSECGICGEGLTKVKEISMDVAESNSRVTMEDNQ